VRSWAADIDRMSTNMRLAGWLLLVGSAVTLGLHLLGAPEDLYRWSYRHLLSGLDVPKDPSTGTVDAVRYTSLAGGLAELATGCALLLAGEIRRRRAPTPG
jgi:hypothetical protein